MCICANLLNHQLFNIMQKWSCWAMPMLSVYLYFTEEWWVATGILFVAFNVHTESGKRAFLIFYTFRLEYVAECLKKNTIWFLWMLFNLFSKTWRQNGRDVCAFWMHGPYSTVFWDGIYCNIVCFVLYLFPITGFILCHCLSCPGLLLKRDSLSQWHLSWLNKGLNILKKNIITFDLQSA